MTIYVVAPDGIVNVVTFCGDVVAGGAVTSTSSYVVPAGIQAGIVIATALVPP